MKVVWILTICLALSSRVSASDTLRLAKATTKWLASSDISEEMLANLDTREDSLFQVAYALFKKGHRLGFISKNEFVAAPVLGLGGVFMLEGVLYFYTPAAFTLIGAGIALVPVALVTALVSSSRKAKSKHLLNLLKVSYDNRMFVSSGGG